MVGKLLHLTHTRPEIPYAVSVVSRYMHTPQTSHPQAVKRIYRYLAGMWDSGILFGRGVEEITGHSDSEYAGDIESGRSTSGFVFCFGALPSLGIQRNNRLLHCQALKPNIELYPKHHEKQVGWELFWETTDTRVKNQFLSTVTTKAQSPLHKIQCFTRIQSILLSTIILHERN